jgi:hypothetical protein
MAFDEQLRQAFETLTDRVRDEVARELRTITDELAAGAAADRERAASEAADAARADAERAADAARADAERAADARVTEAQHAADARVTDAALAADRRVADAESAAATRLAGAVSEAESAGEKRALEAADERLRKAVDEAVAAARASLRTADLAASQRLLDAIRAIDRTKSLSEILDTLVSCAGREASRVGILLVRAGATVKAWRLIGFGASFDAAPDVELPIDEAGVIGEAVRTAAAASSDTAGRLTTPPFDLPDGRERVAVPIPMSGQVVAVLYGDQGPEDDPHRDATVAWPATLEVMGRHAARCLEALTAFKAARVLTERPDVPASPATPDAAGVSAGDADRPSDDEAARRYARLLVSEIKLYHEPAVAAGRRERDLATRLSGEIARARVLYEQRVPAQVREQTDHFHAELVRTLANGDATLLGQTT